MPHENIIWRPPGDKSISQRATFLTSLAEGTSRISGLLWSEDTINNLKSLKQIGVQIKTVEEDVLISGVGKYGYHTGNKSVNLGNSATSSRIMLALLCGQRGCFRVDGNQVLRRRPMSWIVESLRDMGAKIEWEGETGYLPVDVTGTLLKGRHHRIRVSSAQAVSALLFAALLADNPTRIYRKTKARDHTERLFNYFGFNLVDTGDYLELTPPNKILALDLSVPGDVSSAAFLVGLVAMQRNPGLSLTVKDVNLNPTRTGFLDVIRRMGADIDVLEQGTVCGEPIGKVVIRSGRKLKGVTIAGDAFVQSMIDEIPIIAAVAATAEGETVILDAHELADKDTDRAFTTIELLRQFGINARSIDGGLIIPPGPFSSPGTVTVPNDHRIAMVAMIIASCCAQETIIHNWDVVRVSFPGFLDEFNRIGHAVADSELKLWGPHSLEEVGV
ncbi:MULTISPECIES: 3-phosphoshikimate 1-carboxyvinyltransferase [unclassified Lysinibacillus]|uniref:3-phosphoshikimate 1-carboxyvinyltransferase n=1 Tax=unclassified Lysinibacillus TaxID=2636778 RepID=UPI003824D657